MKDVFEVWWDKHKDGYPATPLMQECFSGGFWVGFRVACMLCISAAVLIGLSGCQDHYRYPCQNPDNFYKPDCQKPKCLFTQQCPEYLVAPILEKAVNASQPASEASANR